MMEKNEIIEAEYTEISDEHNALCEITAKIRIVTASLIWNFIELGKQFEKAKAIVKDGKWEEYCEQCTGYKRRMADNYIMLYHEYEPEQLSLYGNMTNWQSIANLGVTKLIELTAIPAEERERFVEDNNIDESTTVKELKELIAKQKQELWDKDIEHKNDKNSLAQEIKEQKKQIDDANNEIERLTTELEAMKNTPPVDAPNSDVAALIAEAEENVRASTQKAIDELRAENEKKQKEIEKKQKQLDKLKNNDLAAENTRLKESVSEAEKKNADLEAEITKVRREAQVGSNEKLVRLNLCFQTVQNDIQTLADALGAVKDADNYEKLRAAITGTLEDLVRQMKEGQ